MQKLEQRTKKSNTPTDAPQVRSNCGLQLNKEETLSVASSKTRSNNPEVEQPQHTAGLKAIVYVLSIAGTPLMPCTSVKAKKLLRSKRARIAKYYPFTIQLEFECENQIQACELGIDTGAKFVGASVVSEKKELFSATLTLDDKTSSRLTERAMHRKNRRSRLWYRKPRFLNRKKPAGWLPPSTQRKYDTHLRIIALIKSILPISKVTIETANFEIAKIINPETEGTDYQQGDMYGYQNVRSFLMARERGCCQLCHKEFSKGAPSHIHHIKQRNEQGSDRPENLAILHKKCHDKLHEKGLKLSPPKSYQASAFMVNVQHRFKQDIPGAAITYGYITFIERQKLALEKSHSNDAFVIAGGSNQERRKTISIRQKHRNGRILQVSRKGFAPAIRRQRYPIQPKDLVWIDGKKYVASGMQNKGTRVIVESPKRSISANKIERVHHFGGFAHN